MLQEEEWFKTWFDSPYYHILYKDRNYLEAEQFISDLLSVLELPKGTKCLDLACGKGRHSIYLSKHGLDVVGLDLSENSIEEAKPFENEQLFFDVHDMREVYEGTKFGVVFNLFTSFGYFDDYHENVKVLESINKMLLPDGILVIDFMNAYHVLHHLVKDEVKTVKGIEFHLNRAYDGKHIIKNIEFSDNGIDYSFQEKVQAIKLDDFEILLENAGFDIQHVYGDSKRTPFDKKTANHLIIIAKRK